MPRLPRPDRSAIGDDEFAAYDLVAARDSQMVIDVDPDDPWHEEEYMGGYFGVLLNSPQLAAGLTNVATILRTIGGEPGTYSHADREWVDQVLCPDWGTNLPMRTHLPDALAAGVRPEAILALREGREDELTEDERLLATYVRQVVSGTVSDTTFEAVKARFGSDRGIVEYTVFIAYLQLTLRLMQAFGVRDIPDAEFMAMLRSYVDGTREVPDHKARIR